MGIGHMFSQHLLCYALLQNMLFCHPAGAICANVGWADFESAEMVVPQTVVTGAEPEDDCACINSFLKFIIEGSGQNKCHCKNILMLVSRKISKM